jgi:hypothetical protein
MKIRAMYLIIVAVLFVIVAAGFIYYYVWASSTLSRDNSKITSLQSTVELSLSSNEANAITVNQAAGGSSPIVTFTANNAGYIVVSGTSTSITGHITIKDSYNGYPDANYSFGTGASKIVPVLPGSVSVFFGNSDLVYGATATISVVYYY